MINYKTWLIVIPGLAIICFGLRRWFRKLLRDIAEYNQSGTFED